MFAQTSNCLVRVARVGSSAQMQGPEQSCDSRLEAETSKRVEWDHCSRERRVYCSKEEKDAQSA